MTDTEQTRTIDRLRSAATWPPLDGVPAYHVELDGGGRELIHALLFSRRVRTMLQIGCLLNGSVRRWLRSHPDLTVIGVDPWCDAYLDVFDSYIRDPVMIPLLGPMENRAAFVADLRRHGFYASALAAVAEHRDRFIPVRGASPEALPALKAADLSPELIYIDADKKPDDLYAAADHWPAATLCGDDWSWRKGGDFPMQRAVRTFAETRGYEWFATRATWILRRRA